MSFSLGNCVAPSNTVLDGPWSPKGKKDFGVKSVADITTSRSRWHTMQSDGAHRALTPKTSSYYYYCIFKDSFYLLYLDITSILCILLTDSYSI